MLALGLFQLTDQALLLLFSLILIVLHRYFESLELCIHSLVDLVSLSVTWWFLFGQLGLKMGDLSMCFGEVASCMLSILRQTIDQCIVLSRLFIKPLHNHLCTVQPFTLRWQLFLKTLDSPFQLVVLRLLLIQTHQQRCFNFHILFLTAHLLFWRSFLWRIRRVAAWLHQLMPDEVQVFLGLAWLLHDRGDMIVLKFYLLTQLSVLYSLVR